MRLDMRALSAVFSRALDAVEKELFGIGEFHGMRVAAFSAAVGRHMGMDDDNLSVLTECALFHDNALMEYQMAERLGKGVPLKAHCEIGQRSVSWLPFQRPVDGVILYHHERPDGRGPFGLRAYPGEYPLEAAIISAVDSLDLLLKLNAPRDAEDARRFTRERPGMFGGLTETLCAVMTQELLDSLLDENIQNAALAALPPWHVEWDDPVVLNLAAFVAHIIDYKSKFTKKHTTQIANRAWLMAGFYGYGPAEKAKLYLAAALHDIGKTGIPAGILEKPGQLDDAEFAAIKRHVRLTHDWLADVPDFTDVANWAADHHEKLNGQGYPFGKNAAQLDFNARLMACIDIYQAVSEERPYHAARAHAETMPILRGMAASGFVDAVIVDDLDKAMAPYSLRDVPPPVQNGE